MLFITIPPRGCEHAKKGPQLALIKAWWTSELWRMNKYTCSTSLTRLKNPPSTTYVVTGCMDCFSSSKNVLLYDLSTSLIAGQITSKFVPKFASVFCTDCTKTLLYSPSLKTVLLYDTVWYNLEICACWKVSLGKRAKNSALPHFGICARIFFSLNFWNEISSNPCLLLLLSPLQKFSLECEQWIRLGLSLSFLFE